MFRLIFLFYLIISRHTIEVETELIGLMIISEILLGFFMSVATFRILPIAIEISGVFTAFFGVIIGVFGLILLKISLQNHSLIRGPLGCVVLMLYYLFFMPFSTYFANGIFLGSLAGYLLAVQITFLSVKNEEEIKEKKSGIWYLFGLLVGILLK